ncbi:MAG: flagellar export chaperone FliS [Piscirickettsiaceae bacterium]|nr:MAG: flagellar export chaperone FliS [Piscirickettsiaceae bacterium]PCI66148.1 MAG: flagellar export chaperone FliS [Piscirickettsiaceae bacterium]
MNGATALKQYQQVGVHGAIMDASPHRLIQMLLDGALTRILAAKGHMKQNNISKKGEQIGSAISIIESLKASLDFEQGGEISKNLDALYEYIGHVLLKANTDNNSELLDEAGQLISQIKMGWDAIDPNAAQR